MLRGVGALGAKIESVPLTFTSEIGWLVVLLFYVHGKHLRSCRDGQLT